MKDKLVLALEVVVIVAIGSIQIFIVLALLTLFFVFATIVTLVSIVFSSIRRPKQLKVIASQKGEEFMELMYAAAIAVGG